MALAYRKKIVKNPVCKKICCFCFAEGSSYIGRPNGKWTVTCGFCGAHGPICDSKESALRTWKYGVGEEDL